MTHACGMTDFAVMQAAVTGHVDPGIVACGARDRGAANDLTMGGRRCLSTCRRS
jgi:hypothetical protein